LSFRNQESTTESLPLLPESYPWTTRVGDLEITFRFMGAEDGERMLTFTRSLPERDLLFLRYDITDPEVVEDWLRNIARGQTRTLLALEGERLVGYCSLHRSKILWSRHLGEIRMLVGNNERGKGLGRRLIEQIFPYAGEEGLQKLVVQMMSTQRDAQTLFHHLGFIPEALLHDWAIDRNGRTHDMIIMSREVDEDED
jgi:RimJ/RimL family protein N-acetyltransferase